MSDIPSRLNDRKVAPKVVEPGLAAVVGAERFLAEIKTPAPILVYADVGRAIEWLCTAFGFRERLRAQREGVVGHAQLAVGEGAIMLGREGGPFHSAQGKTVSAYVHITVLDVESHFQTARERGAKVIVPPSDMPFGERQYTVEDHEGHWWTFSQHVADVPPEEWGATMAQD